MIQPWLLLTSSGDGKQQLRQMLLSCIEDKLVEHIFVATAVTLRIIEKFHTAQKFKTLLGDGNRESQLVNDFQRRDGLETIFVFLRGA